MKKRDMTGMMHANDHVDSEEQSKRSRKFADCSLSVSDISSYKGSEKIETKKKGKKGATSKSKSRAKGSDKSDKASGRSKSAKSSKSKALKSQNEESYEPSLRPDDQEDGSEKYPAETVIPGNKREGRKELIKKIRAYETKKILYASKIKDIQFKSDNLDKDLKVLRDKVKQEVKDLNALNREIDKEMEQINRMNKIRERKMYYQKEVKSQ